MIILDPIAIPEFYHIIYGSVHDWFHALFQILFGQIHIKLFTIVPEFLIFFTDRPEHLRRIAGGDDLGRMICRIFTTLPSVIMAPSSISDQMERTAPMPIKARLPTDLP